MSPFLLKHENSEVGPYTRLNGADVVVRAILCRDLHKVLQNVRERVELRHRGVTSQRIRRMTKTNLREYKKVKK